MTLQGCKVRGGCVKVATITGATKSLFTYQAGGIEKIFAADNTNIYDVTTPTDVDVPPVADVTGQTNGGYSTVIHANAGGTFLLAFNGADLHQVYNGGVWATNTPAITFTADAGQNTTSISSAWTYKNRLFMVEKDSMNVHYLSVDTIGGAASVLSLAGVFNKGGSVLFGTTWSTSAGDGLADRCVIVSTLGQVAVYNGSNPGDAADWQLVGVYDIGTPIGERAVMRAGNDVIIGTNEGMIPLSQAVVRDVAALSLAALSSDIEDEWRALVAVRGIGDGWSFKKWSKLNLAIISVPSLLGNINRQLVVNLLSGKWSDFEGWDIQAMDILGSELYFGDATGSIHLADQTGSDNGTPYSVAIAHAFQAFNRPNRIKNAALMRATFKSSTPFTYRYSVSQNLVLTLPTYPNAATDTSVNDVWDVGLWDVAKWDATGIATVISQWRSVFGNGYTLAPCIQITMSSVLKPDIELVSTDFEYFEGAKVVR